MADRSLLSPTAREVALNVELAVLDASGVIVAVNEGWDAFALYNGGDLATTGVGVSYLDVCDGAGDDLGATTTATMIRAALSGMLTTATSLVIPCHSDAELRWFELFVSPRVDGRGHHDGATVMLIPSVPPGGQPGAATGALRDELREPIRTLFGVGLDLRAAADELGGASPYPPLQRAVDDLEAVVSVLRRLCELHGRG